ncbi:hypothetical protein GMD78_05700 [Ornithinibacillus sp. L9]|uniref:Uncharacterized protein n=1 Tax=Ornithinibacillus caprae TaxID=2678566 RepID=A0A6N8FE00_9BACI|nr:hypothetical protein [Ornithinibacillus caprae]MUK87892.1 hypothetical protein [Ornithinibacillus caprae]
MKSNIDIYESMYQEFNPIKHINSRIKEMEIKSEYGAVVASKWTEFVHQSLINEAYPVVHPIGQETFSLFVEFPTGVFEYALDIDGATSLINEKKIVPLTFSPLEIFMSVDQGNINTDPNRIKPNHKNPVMVLQSEYLTNNKPYCINGNHRIFEAYRNNNEQIEVFVFKDMEFVPFIYDDLSKAMYFFEIDYDNVMNNKRNYIRNEKGSFANEFYEF